MHMLVFEVPFPVSQYVDVQSEFVLQKSPNRLVVLLQCPGSHAPEMVWCKPPHRPEAH
jgi:hypothetical protein